MKDNHNRGGTCSALSHETKVRQQQTDLEAENTGYIAVGISSCYSIHCVCKPQLTTVHPYIGPDLA
jgi:hypothetical protein